MVFRAVRVIRGIGGDEDLQVVFAVQRKHLDSAVGRIFSHVEGKIQVLFVIRGVDLRGQVIRPLPEAEVADNLGRIFQHRRRGQVPIAQVTVNRDGVRLVRCNGGRLFFRHRRGGHRHQCHHHGQESS